ncbi:MAG: glycosyltransferase family 2 protein [Bacteroidota bacterium]
MKKIAALYTCHNRKEKTLKALKALYGAYDTFKDGESFELDVFLTDDGSTDGTGLAVKQTYPDVYIQEGNGQLFWAEGMRKSWKEALKGKYDAYLLLNDDTDVYPHVFDQLIATHTHCIKEYGQSGIYIGATKDQNTGKLTYSGSVLKNRFLYTKERLSPNGSFQPCHLGNANIMMATADVVDRIGILSEGYAHGKADYDYTLMAVEQNIPVLIAPQYCGNCINDHRDMYDGFAKMTLKERKKKLLSPTGLDFQSHIKFSRKFFPLRAPMVWAVGWFKILFPHIYLRTLTKSRN